jgi:DNA helicase HerA-like ATPase
VRLIRSKGVGVYFVTQSPLDVPEAVLGQLGNRIQHALRAFTPKDQKAVRAAAETFRANQNFDAATAITELGVGEALVSTLGDGGVPGVVERVKVRPPQSRLGPVTPAERQGVMQQSPVRGRYDQAVDRESAYEMLKNKAAAELNALGEPLAQSAPQPRRAPAPRRGQRDLVGTLTQSMVRTVGSSLGRQIVRGLLGAILKR